MKLYIAGPMTDLPDNNFPEFHRVDRKLTDLGHEVINPASLDEYLGFDNWHNALRRDIIAILMGQQVCGTTGNMSASGLLSTDPVCGIVALSGWENSDGARWELGVCLGLGIPCYNEDLAKLNLYCPPPTIYNAKEIDAFRSASK